MADAVKALDYLIFLARHLDKENASALATLIMIDLNFSETHDGFQYLRKAIGLYMEYPENTLMKVIYTDVGFSFIPKVKYKRVERSMRTAIGEAWSCGNKERWGWLFNADKNGETLRPTSSDFIARVASFIGVWQTCKEVVR